jgi:hypothetical protein
LIIFAFCSWEIASDIGLDSSFDDM